MIRKHAYKNTRSQSELEFYFPTKHQPKITKIRDNVYHCTAIYGKPIFGLFCKYEGLQLYS